MSVRSQEACRDNENIVHSRTDDSDGERVQCSVHARRRGSASRSGVADSRDVTRQASSSTPLALNAYGATHAARTDPRDQHTVRAELDLLAAFAIHLI